MTKTTSVLRVLCEYMELRPSVVICHYSLNYPLFILLQGALAGTLTSLVVMLWIGVGAYVTKPSHWKAPVNVEGCNWNLTLSQGVENVTSVIEATTRSLNSTPAVEMASPR